MSTACLQSQALGAGLQQARQQRLRLRSASAPGAAPVQSATRGLVALRASGAGLPGPAPRGLDPASPLRREGRAAGGLHVTSAAAPDAQPTPGAPLGIHWLTDEWKEDDRKNLRTVFDFEAWKNHRSSSRYWRHMSHLPNSRIFKWVAPPLSFVTAVAVGVCAYHTAAETGVVPEVLPELAKGAAAPFGLTSFALSTLLVLRTNTSYQRWDEARKMWGLIVNRSRDVARQALGYIPTSQPELQDMFCRWLVAYSRSLMCHLRPGEDLRAELKDTLKPEELEALMASTHRPNYVCQVLTAIIKKAQLPGDNISNMDSGANVKASAAFRMDENLTCFADVTGGCERILRTPVPLMYTRHNSRFLMIWLTLLPFTLWDTCHWSTVPVTALVSFLLLGIKEIGVCIEEPFTILPLEVISRTIEGNVWELHRMHSARGVEKQAADGAELVVTADALVDVVVDTYATSTSNGAMANGAATAAAAVPAVELLEAAAALRAAAAEKVSALAGTKP